MSPEDIRRRPSVTPSSATPPPTVVERRPVTRAPADTTYTTHEEVQTVETAPGFVLGRPHLHWGPIFAGLLSALTTLFLLSLLGGALGLTQFNAATAAAQGSIPADAARNSGIWAGIAGILSFLLGGYVASRLAHMLDRNWGAWHGALVFMLALPIALWLAGQGLGAVLGTVGNVASGLAVGESAAALRNTLWGALVGSLLGLGASALGGWLGAHHLLSMTTEPRPVRRR